MTTLDEVKPTMNKQTITCLKKSIKEYTIETKGKKIIPTIDVCKDGSFGTGWFMIYASMPLELQDMPTKYHNISLLPDTKYYKPVTGITEDYHSEKYPAAYRLNFKKTSETEIYSFHIQKNLYDMIINIFGPDTQVEIDSENPYRTIVFKKDGSVVALIAPLRCQQQIKT